MNQGKWGDWVASIPWMGSGGRRAYSEYPEDPRPSKPGMNRWTLKADTRDHQTLYILLLVSNYCSHLTNDTEGTQLIAWPDPMAAHMSARPPVPLLSPPPFVRTGSLPIRDLLGTGCALQQPTSSPAQQTADCSRSAGSSAPWYLGGTSRSLCLRP